MRVLACAAFALALGVAAPAAAKGPAWTSTRLSEAKHFGNVHLRAGDAAVYSSGAPAWGTLASPFALSRHLVLPEGTFVSFLNETASAHYWPTLAAVPGSFPACGIEFGKEPASGDSIVEGHLVIPRDTAVVRPSYVPPEERSELRDSVAITGRPIHPITAQGLTLPAGGELGVRCDGNVATPSFFSGSFPRETDVGGVFVRAGAPVIVVFAVLGPHVMEGVLARPSAVNGRLLPEGTRLSRLEAGLAGGVMAVCEGGKTSVFLAGAWAMRDCGSELPSTELTRSAGRDTATVSARGRSAHAFFSPAFVALFGAIGLVGLLARAFWVRIV